MRQFRWDPMMGPVLVERSTVAPEPGPPNCSIPGAPAVSYCADCRDGLHPKERCSAVSERVRRELPLAELYRASLCPFDLRDELDRRRFGATRAELEEAERTERDLRDDEDDKSVWCYIPDRLRRRRIRK
jgi:hypothetical protein